MIFGLIALTIICLVLLWFIRDQAKKHDERVDELLTWVKDTPTAVMVSSTNGQKELLRSTIMDDDEMARREADYESEAAPAGPDDE